MEERTMYVIQRYDGKFYWKHQSISSYYGYDSFDKAHLFSTEKGAKTRISTLDRNGHDCKIKQVKVILVD